LLHFDYTWDLDSRRILLDKELDTDKLQWRAGDLFKFVDVDGQRMLVRMDPLEAFIKGHPVNVKD
jgi:hypothetical protein